MSAAASLPAPSRASGWTAYPKSAAVIAACTALAWTFRRPGDLSPTVMVYLLGVVLVAIRWGHGPSALATALSVLAFDYFFEIPAFSFAVADWGNLLVFSGMLLVAQLVAELVDRLRQKVALVEAEQKRTESLYALSQDLGRANGVESVMDAALHHLRSRLRLEARVWRPRPRGGWQAFPPADPGSPESLPDGALPLVDAAGPIGYLDLDRGELDDASARAIAGQIAMALSRALLAGSVERARLDAETERMRNAVLSAVSHDLRTPLSAITGAASSLLLLRDSLSEGQQKDMLASILEESEHLTRLVTNLLEVTTVESGALKVQKDWQPLDDVVGAALNHFEARHGSHPLRVDLPRDLPWVPLDPVLVEHVLLNLLENALRHAPSPEPIRLSACVQGDSVVVAVEDRGAGIPQDLREAVFEKFFQMPGSASDGGVGLGLAICRGMVAAHGGRIWVEPREGGGSRFCFSLPIEGQAPPVPEEEPDGEP